MFLWEADMYLIKLRIKKSIIAAEPPKTISWENGIFDTPTPTEKITKARLKQIIIEEMKFSVQSEPEEEYDDFDL